MRSTVVLLLSLFVAGVVTAQKRGEMRMLKPKSGAICYSSFKNEGTRVGPPREYLNRLASGAKTNSANIIVTYEGFTLTAKAAFQEAVDIWSTLLESPVTIRIHARWTSLGTGGILGQAGPGAYFINFDGAPKRDVWYPVALAEKLAGKNLNGDEADIVASFNSDNNSWHFGLSDQDPTAGKYDLVSIVMHEIGHGLGITHAYEVSGNTGGINDFFDGAPVVYETNILTSEGKSLVSDYVSPSTTLKTMLTGGLTFRSTLVQTAAGTDAILYSPAIYSGGSSVAHLNENSYPAGDDNSLMTPFIGSAERMLDPGPIGLAILNEIGWTSVSIKHLPVQSTEDADGPYTVLAQVTADGSYDANEVKVTYKTTGPLTTVKMVATGNPNEFAFDLPPGSTKYSYFISVKKDDGRIITKPGSSIPVGSPPQRQFFSFEAGPDTKGPYINHKPVNSMSAIADLKLSAIVSDNLGVEEVFVELKRGNTTLPEKKMPLVDETDSTYAITLTFNGLVEGEIIEYRIRAKDKANAGNISYKPSASTYYSVTVNGLLPTQDKYTNNFDNVSATDFFGTGFTVATPTGFLNGAIHSDHPYEAGGASGASVTLEYYLKVPVRVNASEPSFRFDEIVLVEPGEPGAAWPSDDFYDYVVVEGSKDGGLTWTPMGDGYDSRVSPSWLSKWNSASSENNSTALGTPALYLPRSYNLLDKFDEGDEVSFRFRLFSDPFSVGWGWSIDNLKIQIDDIAPEVRHNHYDYVMANSAKLNLSYVIEDANEIEQIFIDYKINQGSIVTLEVLVDPLTAEYTTSIDIGALGLKAGDDFRYRIRAIDINNNQGVYPTAIDFIKTAVISMASPIDKLSTDFSAEIPELTGNFFYYEQPGGFTSKAMASIHPYYPGLGVNKESDYVWMTRRPIKVSATNPYIVYNEVALVESAGISIKDYVVVEGSKDGITWEEITIKYSSSAVPAWELAFGESEPPTASLLRSRFTNITTTGKFKAGDNILIRFRLHSGDNVTGWGWLVDDLSIQGEITGLEDESTTNVAVWPNPVHDGLVRLSMQLPGPSDVDVQWMSLQGQLLSHDRFSAPEGSIERSYPVSDWAEGIYIMRVSTGFGTSVRKIVRQK